MYPENVARWAYVPEERQRRWIYFKLEANIAFDVYPDQKDVMQMMPISPTDTLIREIDCCHPDALCSCHSDRYFTSTIRACLTGPVRERCGVVGGAEVTEESHPGFRNSAAAYTATLLSPKAIRDLDPPRQGLRVVERKMANFLPLDDSRYLKIGGG